MRGSAEDCQSFWSTSVDSDYALVRALFSLHLVCGHISTKATFLAQQTIHDNGQLQLQLEISMGLSSQQQIMKALHSTASATQNSSSPEPQERCLYSSSVAPLHAPKSASPEARRALRRQLVGSLGNEREKWWIWRLLGKMGKALAIGNSGSLYRLIWNTGPLKPSPTRRHIKSLTVGWSVMENTLGGSSVGPRLK